MSDGFKLSIFGGNKRNDKKRGKESAAKQKSQDTMPKAEAEPKTASVAELVAATPEYISEPTLSSPDLLAPSANTTAAPSAAELEAFFPSERSEAPATGAQMTSPLMNNKMNNEMSNEMKNEMNSEQLPAVAPVAVAVAAEAAAQARIEERRRKRRARISTPVRVRSLDITENGPDEITTTVNISRIGILIETSSTSFFRSMPVAVVLPYSKTPGIPQAEQEGFVVRVSELPDGRRSVAVALGIGVGDLINTAGHKLELHSEEKPEHAIELVQEQEPVQSNEERFGLEREADSGRPLVLALDADCAIRDSIKDYLSGEGYDVIAVGSANEAREVLKLFTPALVIAAIEGEGMPGYDICAHCKSTPRLQRIPVMLMTSSAYPSDYSSAHSVGAVVCMAKPYKQERLGHVVRLLAPPPNAEAVPLRPADPTRRHARVPARVSSTPAAPRRFRFGGKS